MNDMPELHPPRIIITSDGSAPITVPDDLKAEWHGKPIPCSQEYVRADIVKKILAAANRAQEEWASWVLDQYEGTTQFNVEWPECDEHAAVLAELAKLTTTA